MKKIIKGKMYNTDTAKKVGDWYNQYGRSDFNYVSEELYQKRTGEFFIYGEGGPNTKYAVSAGQNCWSGGSDIIPVTWEVAREWAEEKLSADEYESIFGEVAEDDSKTVVTLSMSVDTLERARRSAAQAGVRLSAYFESLIIGTIDQDE